MKMVYNRKNKPEWMTNRQQKKEPKICRTDICIYCDVGMSANGVKCSICGNRSEKRRNKKPGPLE